MRNRIIRAGFFGMLVLWLVAFPEASQQQDAKVVEWFVFETPRPIPQTMEEMFDAVHSVARITIERARVEVQPARSEEPYPQVRTRLDARIDEVFKKHPAAAKQELTLIVEGGEYRQGDTIYREINRGIPALEVGHTYVVFLYWKDKEGGFRPQFGADSIFAVEKGAVRPLGHKRIEGATEIRNPEEFGLRLRDLAAARGA